MFILDSTTIWNGRALDQRIVQNRVLGRMMVLPRRGASAGVWARLIFENQLLRYMLALLPFVVAMLIWPHLALPIAQAPLIMVIVIGFVEMRILHIPKDKRPGIVSEADAARALDALRFRATAILRKIAAGRDLHGAELQLVVEQSELANIAPLTVISLHQTAPRRMLLTLDDNERTALAGLFDETFSEVDLQLANQRGDDFVRKIAFDSRAVSAHARLAAYLERDAPGDDLQGAPG